MQENLTLVKEKYCYVSSKSYVHSATDSKDSLFSCYQLPDNTTVTLNNEILVKTPELFFNPSLFKESKNNANTPQQENIVELLNNCVRGTPVKIRNSVSDVVLCGGSSLFTGMVKRFKSALTENIPLKEEKGQEDLPDHTLVAKPYRKYAT